jgi:hypothetical protein
MSNVNDSVKSKVEMKSEMSAYMELELNDPTNHRVYSWVNEEYFYKMLERAKAEKLFVNEFGRVDLYKLIQFLCGAFADGRLVALPNHKCRKSVIEYIAKIASCDDKALTVEKADKIMDEVLGTKSKRNHKKKEVVPEFVDETGKPFKED